MRIEVKNLCMMPSALASLCEFLSEEGVCAEKVFDCKLVVSELVGNIFRHSTGRASVSVAVGEFIEIQISSTQPFTPPKRSALPELFSEHGRGLFLVDSVCVERRVTEEGDITIVIKK